MAYEIRLRENKWLLEGGWGWSVYEVTLNGHAELVDWGWELEQEQALNEANYVINVKEEPNG